MATACGVPTVAGADQFPQGLQRQHPGQRHVRGPGQGRQASSTRPRPASGNLAIVYFGSKTGRDGIHGATMSSTEFTEDSEEKRPTVQVGDPFAEKLLIEACLELMASRRGRRHPGHGRGGPDLARRSRWPARAVVGIELNIDMVPAARGPACRPTR
ncbi:AIR synthase-related protein [Caulobacter segnis]